MNSAVSPQPTLPTSASCHSQLMTAPILSLPPSPQSHKNLILSSHSECHIKLVHCYVCVYMFVYTWLGVWPLAGDVDVCVAVCVSAIWQASLLEKSLSDCRSIWQVPILRKAYGLGRTNKYTRRKSPLLTPGRRMLQSQSCIEYRSKSVMSDSNSLHKLSILRMM